MCEKEDDADDGEGFSCVYVGEREREHVHELMSKAVLGRGPFAGPFQGPSHFYERGLYQLANMLASGVFTRRADGISINLVSR